MNEGLLLPEVDEDSAPFWEATSRGELRIQACAACGALRFPPRPMCPRCRSLECNWPLMSGKGTVWSYVVPHPPLLSAYAELAPYNVIVVSLDEDPTIRLVGNLVAGPDGALDSVDPHAVEIGMPVQVMFQDAGEGMYLPRWTRA